MIRNMESSVYKISLFFITLFVMFSGLSCFSPESSYIGCYDTKALRIQLTIRSSSNTAVKCMSTCFDKTFRYAATQSLACFCGNALRDEHSAVATLCYSKCSGDGSETCGGGSRDISLYDIWLSTPSTVRMSTNTASVKITTSFPTTTTTTSTPTQTTPIQAFISTSDQWLTTEFETITKLVLTKTENKPNLTEFVVISVSSTIAIGIFATAFIFITCRILRRRKHTQEPVHNVETSRTETNIVYNRSISDDNDHIYEQCQEPVDDNYNNNNDYLAPVASTSNIVQNRTTCLNMRHDKNYHDKARPTDYDNQYTSIMGDACNENAYDVLNIKEKEVISVYRTVYDN